ncbi:MAG: hypothetical protein DRO11_00585 [Methanobacteriota archaeon]|nr:MAG: hypothetical protein DRO11_00585 [Euryarchaeota archaeon]
MVTGLDIEKIYSKISDKISREEFDQAVNRKVEELGGLITVEGAAIVIARELGLDIALTEEKPKKFHKISELVPGMMDVHLEARVAMIGEIREFEYGGRKRKVANVRLADKTGSINLVLWGDRSSLVEKLRLGDIVRIEHAMAREGYKGETELSLGWNGVVKINPNDIDSSNFPRLEELVTPISKLEPGMIAVDVYAKVKNVGETRVFTRPDGSEGRVAVLGLVDNTGEARVSLWDNHTTLIEEKKIRVGDAIHLQGAYTREGVRGTELHLGARGKIRINPEDIEKELPRVEVVEYKVGELTPGLEDVGVVGWVAKIFPVREFGREDGTKGSVGSLLLVDDTGQIRVTFWGGKTEWLERLEEGNLVKFEGAQVRESISKTPELHINWKSNVVVLDDELDLPTEEIDVNSRIRCSIGEAEPNMVVEVVGTVLKVYELPVLYWTCTTCNRVSRKKCGCSSGRVEPILVVRLLLDDGSGAIGCLLIGEAANSFLGLDPGEAAKMVEETGFENAPIRKVKEETTLEGVDLVVTGLVRKTKRPWGKEIVVTKFDRNVDYLSQAKKALDRIKKKI